MWSTHLTTYHQSTICGQSASVSQWIYTIMKKYNNIILPKHDKRFVWNTKQRSKFEKNEKMAYHRQLPLREDIKEEIKSKHK